MGDDNSGHDEPRQDRPPPVPGIDLPASSYPPPYQPPSRSGPSGSPPPSPPSPPRGPVHPPYREPYAADQAPSVPYQRPPPTPPYQEPLPAPPYQEPLPAPPYQQPPAHSYGYGYGAPPPTTDSAATLSLVLGIVSFLCLGPLLSLPGLIAGLKALRRIEQSMGRLTGRGLAMAGIVLSSINLALAVLLIVLFLIGIAVDG